MKGIITCLTLFSALYFSYGQTKLAEFTFENPGGYATSITEFTDFVLPNTQGRDYFIRTDGSNLKGGGNGVIFSNVQGSYFFAAQDTDAEGAPMPAYLNIDNINISGYNNIEFRVHLAEDNQVTSSGSRPEHWDNGDYVRFRYDIDNSGTLSNLLWIENDGTGGNTAPYIDTDFDGVGDGTEITDVFTQFTQNITGIGDLLDIEIEFRLNGGHEDIAIDNIEIWGTLVPCATTTTWDGATWSAGAPNLNTTAIINANYDTGADGNFSACNLTVNTGFRLTIDNSDYVEVQNDVTVDGELFVETEGALVQKNDFGTVTKNGTIRVIKTTSFLNAWYEYTYWSSPVSNETVGDALTDADVNRRFIFQGANFLDSTMETNNNNGSENGQDDIDDDGNDWANVTTTHVMIPGIGYAATHSAAAFIGPPMSSPPYKFDYIFEGPFNNGVIKVPVYRNDSELNDNNWNFIGNPYPSAIDVDTFLATNSNIATNVVIDGAIFLWSQNTPPDGSTNGNQNSNFAVSDYAIINAIGETAGGDGVTPSRHIPSGQGFFVVYSDASTPISTVGDISQGEVVFNNTMRVVDNNDKFFRIANNKKSSKVNNAINKIALDLTSDNGVFNQIMIAYANGATSVNDGMAYDTPKNLSTDAPALFYSVIDGESDKFAIQGKAVEDLTLDESIQLGIKTTIDVPTVFTLGISNLEGDFFTNTPVYLKDNLNNTLHNLNEDDYNFASETGEFNDRFEIVFNSEALSIDQTVVSNNQLSIIEHKNGDIQFKLTSNISMSKIEIIDLQGRIVYKLSAKTNNETYRLPNLNKAHYIAKVTLDNGVALIKKTIKHN